MHAQNWSDALTLLCLLVMEEPGSRAEKIKRFQSAAVAFKNRVSPNFTLTEDIAYDWYIQNESENRKNMSSIYYDTHMMQILNNLKALPDKSDFLFSLMKVAFSTPHIEDDPERRTQRFAEHIEESWGTKFSKAI